MANLGGQMQDLQKVNDAMAKDLSSANADKARLNGDIFSCSWKLKDVTKERDAAVKLNTRHRGTILRKDEEITSKNEDSCLCNCCIICCPTFCFAMCNL